MSYATSVPLSLNPAAQFPQRPALRSWKTHNTRCGAQRTCAGVANNARHPLTATGRWGKVEYAYGKRDTPRLTRRAEEDQWSRRGDREHPEHAIVVCVAARWDVPKVLESMLILPATVEYLFSGHIHVWRPAVPETEEGVDRTGTMVENPIDKLGRHNITNFCNRSASGNVHTCCGHTSKW